MKPIHFVKMEGCGNDYVFVDAGLARNGLDAETRLALTGWIPRLVDRHHGVGGDGLILLEPGARAPVRMAMWNIDGSEGRLCLNGLRCVAKYAAEDGKAGDAFTVETAAGDRKVRVRRDAAGRVEEVEVEAGVPDFRREAIPAVGTGEELWHERFYVAGMDLYGYGVSVGNPHLVLWLDEEDALWRAPLLEIGHAFEHDHRFPEGVNVHLVTGRGRRLALRSWERGSGATLACGTGSVAAFAVARRLGLAAEEAEVMMPGGAVFIREEGDQLIMRGPAREVFRGEWDPSSTGESA
jgi:diaminopimelate epimerase